MEQKDKFFGAGESVGSHEKNHSIYKKTEKVTKALYLVTQHLADSAPIKRHVRDSALSLLDVVSQISFAPIQVPSELSYKKSQADRLVTFTLSLTDLAVASGLMSFKNGSIITDNIVSYKNELISYIEQLIYKVESQISTDANSADLQIDLSHSFFEIDDAENKGQTLFGEAGQAEVAEPDAFQGAGNAKATVSDADVKGHPRRASSNQGQEARKIVETGESRQPSGAGVQSAEPAKKQATVIHKFSGSREGLNQFLNSAHVQGAYQTSNQFAQPIKSAAGTQSSAAVDTYIKNDRQQVILDTIKEKGELSIKDLTDVIQGCSEKTIQRELISLVSTGILSKTGERRWSKYSLATA